jgi:hypothetical protein
MKSFFKSSAAIIILLTVLIPFQTIAVDGQTGIDLQVVGVGICNNNGICESGAGEDSTNCPADCPVVPPQQPGGGGAIFIQDSTPPNIYNLLISEITLNSANISWETNEYSLCQIYLGKDEEYKLEVIIETALYKLHSAKVVGIFPATDYHFKISCRDVAMNGSETGDQKFTTLTPPDTVPPANVANFQALPGDSKITLSWRNPKDLDFKGVKIMRSTGFYPQGPESGILVYDGTGEYFIDTDLTNGIRHYYAAFTYDKTGNYSSGAVVSGVPHEPGVIPPPEEISTSTLPITPEIEKLNLNDFDFLQEAKKISLTENGEIEMKADKPLTLKINYEKVPEVLKTIMVTLEQPATIAGEQNKFFSFILRVNKEKTAYLATLVPPEPGIYPVTISILDYKNQALKQIQSLLVVPGEEIVPVTKIIFYQKWGKYLYILLAILILAVIIYLYKKLKKKKNEESR